MSLVTMPALIGPICGPPLGGFITTYASWHWIFIINVPIGLVGIVLATRYIPNVRAEQPDPFDFVGFVLSGLGIGGLGLRPFGHGARLPAGRRGRRRCSASARLSTVAYVVHARRTPAPILDLQSVQACRPFAPASSAASCSGSASARCRSCCRCCCRSAFNLTPFQSGLITFTGALGSMFMKAAVARVLRRFGYRNVLIYNALISGSLSRRLRDLRARHAVLRDGRDPADRRLLPFAAIHQHQHHRLCRDRAGADEPRHRDGRRRAAIVASTGVAVGALVVEITLRLKHSHDR